MTGDAQTTHEYLIPITRFFSMVRSGWLGDPPGGKPDGRTTLRVRTLANALRQLKEGSGSVDGTDQIVAIPLFEPWLFCMKPNQAHR